MKWRASVLDLFEWDIALKVGQKCMGHVMIDTTDMDLDKVLICCYEENGVLYQLKCSSLSVNGYWVKG